MNYIEIPAKAEKILEILHRAGYEAYVVGGCVRDSILGRVPGDWDITTEASPQQVKELFSRTVDTGIEHGTVTVLMEGEGFEVTTYRIDGDYEDSRHPKEVTFTSSLSEDLKRRDFTINAMAYSHETGLVDEFSGIEDLKNKVIRCVGNPRERFAEDALRMMRAVRFAAQLGFRIDENVKEAIREMADSLERISAERIQTELVKLLVSPHPSWFRLAYETGITSVIMPEFDRIMVQRQHSPHHAYTVGEHTLVAMKNIREDKILRLTLLFHDMGKPDVVTTDENGNDHFSGHAACSGIIAEKIMKRLKFDHETMRKVLILVRNHSMFPQLTARDIRLAAYIIGPELFDSYLEVKRADIVAHHPDVIRKNLDYLDEVERIWSDIKLHGDCMSLRELKLNGNDLISDGMKPGPAIGGVLEQLLMEVLEMPGRNQREYLLEESRRIREEKQAD
ncbi:MAG: CCA tRNA nucleotidyltransferase [Lachnospiraceae bacterium]|nr:CCA tRNA nucleotidyltransferase [Lachnospiraceae bacterium]